MINWFRQCWCKNQKKKINSSLNIYEEPILENINFEINTTFNNESEKSTVEYRIKNMCRQWKISRKDAIELIYEVEKRQTYNY